MTREEFVVLNIAAARYNLQLLLNEEFWEKYPDRDYEWGPRGPGIYWAGRAVVTEHDDGPEDALHELVHLILGQWSCLQDVCEGWILLAFEWHLARWCMSQLPNDLRKRFIRNVLSYQYETATLDKFENTVPKERRHMKAWREAEARAVMAGLLHPDGMVPTWHRPTRSERRRLHRRGTKYETRVR